jgi:quinol monooxygenase YgiN
MNEIKGIARVRFRPGKVEEWKRLSDEAMEIVRTKDTGTLQYEIFLNADESEAVVFERYRDADAAVEHFSNIGHLMEPILATAQVTGEVLGTPNATMKKLLGQGGPNLYTPWMALQDLPAASRRKAGQRRPKRPTLGRKIGAKGKRTAKRRAT